MDTEDTSKNLGSNISGCIDIVTLPCKITCFLLNSGIELISIFANVFFVSTGLTAAEAGFITGTCSVISALAGPFWGLIADKTGYRHLIFVLVCLGFAGTSFSWPWVARQAQHWTLNEARISNLGKAKLIISFA